MLTHKAVKISFEKYWNNTFITNAKFAMEILSKKKIRKCCQRSQVFLKVSTFTLDTFQAIYFFEYPGAPLENIFSFYKGIDKRQAFIEKFKLYPSITMHIFALEFLKLENETANDLQSNKLTCCKVSVVPREK